MGIADVKVVGKEALDCIIKDCLRKINDETLREQDLNILETYGWLLDGAQAEEVLSMSAKMKRLTAASAPKRKKVVEADDKAAADALSMFKKKKKGGK